MIFILIKKKNKLIYKASLQMKTYIGLRDKIQNKNKIQKLNINILY